MVKFKGKDTLPPCLENNPPSLKGQEEYIKSIDPNAPPPPVYPSNLQVPRVFVESDTDEIMKKHKK